MFTATIGAYNSRTRPRTAPLQPRVWAKRPGETEPEPAPETAAAGPGQRKAGVTIKPGQVEDPTRELMEDILGPQ